MACRKILILLVLGAACLLSPREGFCQSGKIALLPFADLSQGASGVSFAITDLVRENMEGRGFALVSQAEIISFMVKNRVRWLGYLGSPYIQRLHDEFGIDYLVLGSVNQRRDTKPMAFALTIKMVRTTDSQIIWAQSAELSTVDESGVLGITDLDEIGDLESRVVHEALLSFPEDPQKLGRPLDVREMIDSVFMEPAIVKPGDTIHCQIRLGQSKASLAETSLSLFFDERIVEATYHEDENVFEASWPAPEKSGRYPVTVTISRPEVDDKEVLVGSYLVDGLAPTVALKIKGQELNGIVVLQKRVDIIPVMEEPEPVRRWVMTVRDANKVVIIGADGRDSLPSHFAWWGQDKGNSLVEDGFYTINLTVWDRAGNSNSTEEIVQVIRRKPKMELAMNEQKDNIALNLSYDGDIPIAYWHLEILNQDGHIISERSGSEASGNISLSPSMVAGQNIRYRLYAQDMLGNRLRSDVVSLVPVTEQKAEEGPSLMADNEPDKMASRETWAEDF